jgi:hypothetical protein
MKFNKLPIEVGGTEMWGARHTNWQFVISFHKEDGYIASFKNVKNVKEQANYIDGFPFDSFCAAEEACKKTYKQLKDPS